MGERVFLEFSDAVRLLPDGDRIHTFMQGGPALVGADWDRSAVIDLLRDGEPELSGEMATSMGHGLVACRADGKPVFIETRKGVV